MKTNIKNIEYIDKNGLKILFINFGVMFILFILPFLPLKILTFLSEPAAILLSLVVFIISKVNFVLLIVSILLTILVLAHSLIPDKTLKNYFIILFCTALIIIYLTMFNLLRLQG